MALRALRLYWLAPLCAVALCGCASLHASHPPNIVREISGNGHVVAVDRGDTRVAAGEANGWIDLWSLPGGRLLRRWSAHADSVNGLAFTGRGRTLVSAGYDGMVAEWDLRGRRLRSVAAGAPVMAMAVGRRRGRLVTGHADGSVRVWRLADLSSLRRYSLHAGAIRAVAIDPRTGVVAASTTHGKVYIMNGDGRSRLLQPPPGDAWSLAFSPDGRVLEGGGWFDLYRWDVASGRLRVLATPHHGIIKALQFSADGRRLATIGRETDSAVYFLDPATGHLLTRFRRHDLCGEDIRFSPDGRYLVTTSDDATVHVWDLRHLLPPTR
jgi:WD40 repeat protein